jgi:cytidylate kinase
MAVIAFTQEMATLGSDVAAGVCEALGLEMVRHEVGDVVAGRMHVKKSLIRRLREGKAGPFERWTADEKSISIFTAEEVFDLAVKGNVLVRGWGATMHLRSVAHVPCVRVCAPMDVRVERLMKRLETDDEKLARHEIEVDDHARASRMSEHFGVHWGDPTLYDLTLNTERLPVATCVDMVVDLAKSAAFQETPASRGHLQDLALRARARAALKANPATAGIDIAIDAEGGRLVLTGIVANDKEHALCHEVAGAVAGASGVEDQLTTMSGRMKRFPQQHLRK